MKRGWYWPLILGALMVLVIGANFILVYVATTDPSFAVEEDYYRKALAWDEKMTQDRRNAELGWSLGLDVAPPETPGGSARVEVSLRGPDGSGIEGASVGLEAFHNARAARILRAEMTPRGEGQYAASLPIRRPGLWEFRFDVSRGDERFTHTAVRELGWRR